MFRNEQGVKEEKAESTLICRPEWIGQSLKGFKHVVALSDGEHLAAVLPATSLAENDKLVIFNIRHQFMTLRISLSADVNAIILLENDELIIANNFGSIYQLNIKYNSFTQSFATAKIDISALALLDERSLAVAHGDCSVSIFDLTTQKETKTFCVGKSKINAMDTQKDGSLLLGNDDGCIFIYNIKNNSCSSLPSGDLPILSLVALPDNTIIFANSDATLHHYDPRLLTILSSRELCEGERGYIRLISLANGLIGCATPNAFLRFEPSWVRNYVDTNLDEVKKEAARYLPADLTAIVTAYAANITLFHSPKMPHQKERVLAESLPAPTSENNLTPR